VLGPMEKSTVLIATRLISIIQVTLKIVFGLIFFMFLFLFNDNRL